MRWTLRHPPGSTEHGKTTPEPPAADLAQWAATLHISPLVAELLWRRGVDSLQAMDHYLSPGLSRLAPPADWPALERAATLFAEAILNERTIAVWGDYDVDGVTASALLLEFLEMCGVSALHHLPHREEEGYGVNTAGVEALAAQGVDFLVTVDCGMTDHPALERAAALGMDVLVTDHHLPASTLPPAKAILNPRLDELREDLATLAGVGVAFFLAAATNSRLAAADRPRCDVRPLLDLAALGILADMVDLKGQNRVLAKNGLLVLGEGSRPGVAALKETASYARNASLGAGQVVFGLAPRINAAGRMAMAEDALAMLRAPDVETALKYARRLDALNSERRAEEERILTEALAQAETQSDRLGLVLAGEDWKAGVVGIVASRVVEATDKPCIILTSDGEGGLTGSGRAAHHFDIHKSLTENKALFSRFGGHKQAAGLAMPAVNLEALREAFHASALAQLGPIPLARLQKTDGELAFHQIDFTLLKELDMLQPFGVGNPEPVFTSPPVVLRGIRRFGKDRRHATLDLLDREARAQLPGKLWRRAHEIPDELSGQIVRIAYTPRIDRYSGYPTIELTIKDFKLLDTDEAAMS